MYLNRFINQRKGFKKRYKNIVVGPHRFLVNVTKNNFVSLKISDQFGFFPIEQFEIRAFTKNLSVYQA